MARPLRLTALQITIHKTRKPPIYESRVFLILQGQQELCISANQSKTKQCERINNKALNGNAQGFMISYVQGSILFYVFDTTLDQ